MKACLVCVPARCGCVGLHPCTAPCPRVCVTNAFLAVSQQLPAATAQPSLPLCPAAPMEHWGAGSGHLGWWTPRDSQLPFALHTSYFVAILSCSTALLKPPRVDVSLSLPCAVSVRSASGHTVFLLAWWWCQASSHLLCLFSHYKIPLCVKKKGCVFPLMKGFCPGTISAPGTTGQSCSGWALAPYVHSAAVPSSLSGSAPSSAGFCQKLLQP